MAFSIPPSGCLGAPLPLPQSLCGRTYVRTFVRTYGRSCDYYVTTKISRIDRLPNLLSNGAPLAGCARRLSYHLNNRVLLSKAPSCDRLPAEIWCSQYEVWTSNFRGNLWHIGPEPEKLYCFYCTTLNFERKLPRRALCADRRPLKRDTIASRDRFQPMRARQNLALYYKGW